VPSAAFQVWQTLSRRALDQIEAARTAVGGTGPGRRHTTQQIDQAYAVLLSSQFQRFCRDLHTEIADLLVRPIGSAALQTLLRGPLSVGRKLDAGNPNPGNIGADFRRLGLDIWVALGAYTTRSGVRRTRLEELNRLAERHRPPGLRPVAPWRPHGTATDRSPAVADGVRRLGPWI